MSPLTMINSLSKIYPPNNAAEFRRLTSLLNDEQESVYLLGESEKIYGASPVVLHTNLDNLSKLASAKFPTNTIEIVRVEISTLSANQAPINMDAFQNFKNLKYLYFLLENESQLSDLQRLIGLAEIEFVVFYQIVKRS